MALPTFFIIGAAKAGTTSLHYYLDQHPQIQMSMNKEPNFFSGSPNGLPYPLGRVSRLDQYQQLFDPTVPVRGEASVSYTQFPRRRDVPQQIKSHVPDAKFIYLVRDPLSRIVSQYHYRVAREGERRSLRDALSDLADPYSVYLCPSFYAAQLQLYLDQFPEERLLVIDQADLLANRRATLRQIFCFLAVDDKFSSSQFDAELLTSSEHRVYSPAYAHFAGVVVSSPLRRLPRRFRRFVRGSIERVLWSPVQAEELEDELRSQLEELYSDDVARLRALTGKTFPSWSM